MTLRWLHTFKPAAPVHGRARATKGDLRAGRHAIFAWARDGRGRVVVRF